MMATTKKAAKKVAPKKATPRFAAKLVFEVEVEAPTVEEARKALDYAVTFPANVTVLAARERVYRRATFAEMFGVSG